jgi:SAM-dependent methyltransferase
VTDYDRRYGERWASIYDGLFATLPELDETVGFLHRKAGGKPALELGVGTGRVAIPLAEAGVEVHGIDVSPEMVDRMKAKPGGDRIPVSFGNFADVDVKGSFGVVYVVFNTLFSLTSQEEQTRCFRNVAAHLEPGGSFVIEAFVPDVGRFDSRGGHFSPLQIATDEVAFEVSRYNRASQQVTTQVIVLREETTRLYPISIRFAYPSELDLMAQLAGLTLVERWADWSCTPFTATSANHVSVYVRS